MWSAAQPDLAAIDHRVGIAQLRLAVAQRLHLGSAQFDPGLELFDQLEPVPGAAIGRDVARRGRPFLLRLLRHRLAPDRLEVDPSARSVDSGHADGDRVPEAERAARLLPDQRRLGLDRARSAPSPSCGRAAFPRRRLPARPGNERRHRCGSPRRPRRRTRPRRRARRARARAGRRRRCRRPRARFASSRARSRCTRGPPPAPRPRAERPRPPPPPRAAPGGRRGPGSGGSAR